MKINRKQLFSIIALASMFILQSYSGGYTLSNEAISPDANSCSTLGCHSAAINDMASTYMRLKDVNNNIVSEYIPNADYKVEIILKKVQGSLNDPKGGFQATILNTSNASAGDFINTSTPLYIAIDTINGVALARHRSSNAGSFLSNDTVSWAFNWKAPAQGTGTLKLNVVANDANGNNNAGGDKIVYSSTTINEASTVGIKSVSKSALNLFPNPATNSFSIALNGNSKSTLIIYDLSGKKVLTESINAAQATINIENLKRGLYYVAIHQNNSRSTSALWKY
jgi:hypothetical protein